MLRTLNELDVTVEIAASRSRITSGNSPLELDIGAIADTGLTVPSVRRRRTGGGTTRLSVRHLAENFRELLRNPCAVTFFPEDGGYFSLAGAQRKKALCRLDGI